MEQEQATEESEEEEIREWLAIIGDDKTNTSTDDIFLDPNYHPPMIFNRQATPIPAGLTEQEEPIRRYPSRTRKEPQRYTVNAITVTTRQSHQVRVFPAKRMNVIRIII